MGRYNLKNKKIIVSGASSGIGKLLTTLLIEKYGCSVIGIGRNEQKLIDLKASLPENSFSYFAFDVSLPEKWADFAVYLENIGFFPDVIINNAGFLPKFAKAEKQTATEAKYVTEVNYLSAVYCFNCLLPLLKKSKEPAFINVSSLAALAPVVGTAYYTASKSALKGFTEIITQEYKKKIYVAGVYPGFTKTNIFLNQKASEKSLKLVDKFCTPVEKTAKKIIKKISRKKKKIVIGIDAKLLNFFYKIFPSFTVNIVAKVLKKANLDLFSDVF